MSYRTKEIALQTEVRHRLLANGYSPVPNYDKRCFMAGRNDVVIDTAMIDLWSTQLKNLSTGVRVEGQLVAIDIDIDDVAAIDAFIDALPQELWDRIKGAPVRRSSAKTKEAWFVRLADAETPFARLTSAAYHRPDDPAGEDGTTHRIEIVGGESGQQMGVFGAHTRDDSDVTIVIKDYAWDGNSLLDVPLSDLPEVTRADLVTLCDTATRVLGTLGWVGKRYLKEGFTKPKILFDLTPDLIFETQRDGHLSLTELIEAARCEDHGLRLSASFHSRGSHNVTRCIASVGSDGALRITDFATAHTHRLASDAPRPVTQTALDRLRELTDASSASVPDEGMMAPSATQAAVTVASDMEQVVEKLLAEYVFLPSEQRNVVPLFAPEQAMTLANFRILMQPQAVTVRGPRGGEQVFHPVTFWVADSRRVDVAGYRFRPDVTAPLVKENGSNYVNTYRALPFVNVAEDTVAGVAKAFEALLAHLVPGEAERDWFRMWLASKIQRPQAVNCGVLLIADQQGTGRGTLFDMMRVTVGQQYHRSISSVELLGTGGQGAYTDWAAQALLVTVEEVMAGADSGGNMGWKRREAYERIKQLVDPRQRVMEIRRKGLQNYSQEVFFSLLMATNHLDALPLDKNDRRIAVIIQPDARFDDVPELKAAVDPWRASGSFRDEFGAALRMYLMSVAVDFNALRIAPELGGGRTIMRDNNEGDLEDILRGVLDCIPGVVILNRDLRRRMQNAVTAEGEGDHLKNWWVKTQDILKRANNFGWRAMQTRQAYVAPDGKVKKGVIYYREAGDALARWADTAQSDRYGALLATSADVNRMISALELAARDGHLRLV